MKQGMATQYLNDDNTHKVIRKLLILQLIPSDDIAAAFDGLTKTDGTWKQTRSELIELAKYIEATW